MHGFQSVPNANSKLVFIYLFFAPIINRTEKLERNLCQSISTSAATLRMHSQLTDASSLIV